MDDEPKDIRLPLMVSRAEAEAIDDWRFANRVRTRAEAVRLLIRRGIAAGPLMETERDVRPAAGRST